jgi:alpha-glucosidase
LIIRRIISENYTVFEINNHSSILGFRPVESGTVMIANKEGDHYYDETEDLDFRESLATQRQTESMIIEKELFNDEHILGFGEKAFELDRRRLSLKMWNTDTYGYQWHTDPLYVSIPFFISTRKGVAKGYFVDSTSKVLFDTGISEYDKITISIPFGSTTFYTINGPKIEQVVENYAKLTGLPFKIPEWALGHHVSRYSYYPEKKVLEIAQEYRRHGIPVSCIYLDIDYMKDRKMFTWDKNRFPNPKKMIDKIHSMGVKVVAILDPGIKLDQNFDVFNDGIGTFCETPNGELYVGRVWPGECVFPDFLNQKARSFWSKQLEKFVSESGLDGIWLDMNEPSIFNESKTFDESILHTLDDDSKVSHSLVHNAYAYFQAKATFESLYKLRKREGEEEAVFILTRAGCAGIQKFAAIWSGDNTSSWRNMRLQIPLLLNLSISGVPFVGCDIGGFIGNSSPELLTRFYQMAAFFPIFRNHKSKEGNDQEPFRLAQNYQNRIKEAILLRYSFLPYLSELALEAHELGHPIIRPLLYEFQDDENTYSVDDQYMVGKHLLYAPIVEKGKEHRELYLPEGEWVEWKTKTTFGGNQWITSETDMPLYLRAGPNLPRELRQLQRS